MHKTPWGSNTPPSSVPLIRQALSYWPVAILLLSFILTFTDLVYGTIAIGVGLLALIVIHAKSLYRSPVYKIHGLDVFVAVCIIIEIIAYFQSSFRFNSRPYLLIVSHAVMTLYFVRYAFTATQLIRAVCWVISLIGLYWAILTIRKAVEVMSFISDHGFTDLSQFRNAYSPLVGTNEWTLFLILLLPFTMTLFLSSQRRVFTINAGLMIVIISHCIMLAFSRGGYIALLCFLVIVFIGVVVFYRQGIARYIKGLLLAAILIGAGISAHWQPVKTTIMMSETVSQQRSTESRWRMWKVGKSTLQSAPWFGIGAYNYPFKYNTDHQRDLHEAPLQRVTSIATQIVTEKGIIGLLIPIAILVYILISSWRFLISERRVSNFEKLFVVASVAAIAAVSIRELTVSTLLFRGFMFHLFCILITLHLTVTQQVWKSFELSRLRLSVLLLPVICLLGLTMWFEMTGYYIIKQNSASARALRSSGFERTLLHSEKIARFLPQHPVTNIHTASALAECTQQDSVSWNNLCTCKGNLDAAVDQLTHAIRMEPRDETIEFALGWLRLCQSRWGDALVHFHSAYRVDSTVAVYPLCMGIVHEKQGDIQAAIKYYARAMVIDPDLYLSQFYGELKQRNQESADEVVKMAVASFDTSSSDPISTGRLGALHFFQDDYSAATKYLTHSMKALPGMNRPYFYLGVISLAAGDTLQSIALWDKSSLLDPNDQLVNWNFGMLLVKRDSVRATALLERALKPRTSEPFHQKRKIFYPEMTPYTNTTLSESFMNYVNPEIDLGQIHEQLMMMNAGH